MLHVHVLHSHRSVKHYLNRIFISEGQGLLDLHLNKFVNHFLLCYQMSCSVEKSHQRVDVM